MADELDNPFMQMMSLSHDGTVICDKAIPLGFDERQSILTQSASALPPASLSNQHTRQLSVVELLERLAKGNVEVAQLSPLQRLQIGRASCRERVCQYV